MSRGAGLGVRLAVAAALGTALAFRAPEPPEPPEPQERRDATAPTFELSARSEAEVPDGLPQDLAARWPADGLAELGRRLFFDPLLSADRSVACASCHDPARGFADSEPLSLGVGGRRTLRNTPTLYNRVLGERFMWDGRAATLEEQVLLPIENELEMALPLEEALARLAAHDEYPARFAAAAGGPPTRERLAASLAGFVRRVVRGDSRVDRFRAGAFGALTPEERGGLWFFESRGGCWRCHAGPNFTDEDFHNTGVGVDGEDAGRMAITGDERDRGAFKTPTLRGLVETAPYMHDGSLTTLEEVVEFYRRGGGANPHLDPRLAPLEMTDRDALNLVAFLKAL